MRCGHGVSEAARGAYATVTSTAHDLFEDILPAVESTVETLAKLHNALTHITYITISTTNLLKECELEKALDADNEMTEGLEDAEQGLRDAVDILRRKRAAAEADVVLNGENKRRVVSAYERAVVALEGLHDAVVEFRWAIMEHDANLENPTGESASSAANIIKLALM
jgi:hypothetical protein